MQEFFRCDNGGEYLTTAFVTELDEDGITLQTKVPHLLLQNSVVNQRIS